MTTAHFPPYGDGGQSLSTWYPGSDGDRLFRQDLIRAGQNAEPGDRDFLAGLERAYLKRGMDHVLPQAGYDRLKRLAFVYLHQDTSDDPPHSA